MDGHKGTPVFVKIDEYKEILDVLDLIKSKVAEISQTLGSINSMKAEEDAELQMWNQAVEDIQGKIDAIDKMMSEPDQSW